MNVSHFLYGDFRNLRTDLMGVIVFHADISKNESTDDKIKGIKRLMANRNDEFCPDSHYLHKVCYKGNYKNGLAEGYGQLHIPTILKYEGRFKNGEIEGEGTVLSERSGVVMKGHFVSGRLQGNGAVSFSSGIEYRGNFIDSVISGKGVFIHKDKSIFEGEIVNGKPAPSGNGVITFPNMDQFKGECAFGRAHGLGHYYSSKDETWTEVQYTNGVKDDSLKVPDIMTVFDSNGLMDLEKIETNRLHRMHCSFNSEQCIDFGTVVIVEISQDKLNVESNILYEVSYSGCFENGLAEGIGYLDAPQYFRYSGQFKKGKFDGDGELCTSQSELSFKGTFKEGLLQGEGSCFASSGLSYKGSFVNSKSSGYGILVLPNVYKYEGHFLDGEMSGEGEITYETGRSYQGEFLKGFPHGQGIGCYENGDWFQGGYAFGKRHGFGIYYYSQSRIELFVEFNHDSRVQGVSSLK